MTAGELAARKYSRHCRTRRRARRQRETLLFGGIIFFAVIAVLAACTVEPVASSPEPTDASPPTVTTSPEPVRHRDDIVSDGRLLAYELQETMQDLCERYGVPYALALAIAEVETHFDPDAVSSGGDTGLMQINPCNHAWLLEQGMDVHTYAGNIEAGIYIIAGHLDAYGDTEKALMAYNCGPGGAKKLWDAGIYQTDYSRKVMAAFERWTSILED